MTASEMYTPDIVDIDEKLSELVDEMQRSIESESPVQKLFAVDGLGHRPNEQRPLLTWSNGLATR
jgi:hypothetical protein